jgi:hypothetical protein
MWSEFFGREFRDYKGFVNAMTEIEKANGRKVEWVNLTVTFMIEELQRLNLKEDDDVGEAMQYVLDKWRGPVIEK